MIEIYSKILFFMKKLFTNFLNILYPYRCPSCKRIVDSDFVFCLDCWKKLQFIKKPMCNICGDAFQFSIDDKAICAKCLSTKPYYDKALCCFIYNKTISRAILEFKFYHKTFLSKFFAKFLIVTIKEIINDVDYIIPIPMSLQRLRWRGFNQSLLLVKQIAKLTNKQIIADLIIKIKHTEAQSKLNHKERKQNLNSAFKTNKKYLEVIKNKNILIIDDVITTGTTVNNCSKVLKKAHVNKVFVASIAKTSFSRKN